MNLRFSVAIRPLAYGMTALRVLAAALATGAALAGCGQKGALTLPPAAATAAPAASASSR